MRAVRSPGTSNRGWSRLALAGALTLALASTLAGGVAVAKKAAKEEADAGAAPSTGPAKAIEKKKWGEVDGKEVDLYTLINKHGLIAKITNFGAILTELDVPD